MDLAGKDACFKSREVADFSLRTRDFAFTMRRTGTRAKGIAYLLAKTFPRAKKRAYDKAYGFYLTYGHCILAEKYVKV